MLKDEFKLICKGMKALYADPKFISNQDAFDMWYTLLQDLDYEIVSMATQAYMQTEKFPPTPADIRRYAQQITAPKTEGMSEMNAWDKVRKALSNGLYGAEEEFERLPKLCQEVIGSPARLREMAQVDTSEVETVVASNFMRNYRARLESHRHDMTLNESLRNSIEQVREDNTPKIEERQTKQIEERPKRSIIREISDKTQLELDLLLGRSVAH